MKINVDFSDLKKTVRKLSKASSMLTPRGFLGDDIHDRLLLYMYKTQYNGIVIEDSNLAFVKVEKKKKK